MHLYFSQAAHPSDVDPDQLKALQNFREELAGLAGQFTTPAELKYLVWQAVNFDLQTLDPVGESVVGSLAPSGVRFSAQPGSDRIEKVDSRGRLKNEMKRWVDLTNQGDADADAEHVTVKPLEDQAFWVSGPDGDDNSRQASAAISLHAVSWLTARPTDLGDMGQ